MAARGWFCRTKWRRRMRGDDGLAVQNGGRQVAAQNGGTQRFCRTTWRPRMRKSDNDGFAVQNGGCACALQNGGASASFPYNMAAPCDREKFGHKMAALRGFPYNMAAIRRLSPARRVRADVTSCRSQNGGAQSSPARGAPGEIAPPLAPPSAADRPMARGAGPLPESLRARTPQGPPGLELFGRAPLPPLAGTGTENQREQRADVYPSPSQYKPVTPSINQCRAVALSRSLEAAKRRRSSQYKPVWTGEKAPPPPETPPTPDHAPSPYKESS
ncbi:uncharacterized protein [Taeniopygia guttata]|uniref:uncharacterized protein n=1 Tax=Taeniopygia guttata TaxID=59729 RepID=UPI003BB98A6E